MSRTVPFRPGPRIGCSVASHDVLVTGTISATSKETGNALNVNVCWVVTVKEGKLTRFQGYLDRAAARRAVGLPESV